MTTQETFDIVARHLLTQGRKATVKAPSGQQDFDACVYRNDDGLKCAVGCLIPDDRYDARFEGSRLQPYAPIGVLMIDLGHDIALLSALQDVHDNGSEVYWPMRLRVVADSYGLSSAVVDEF